MKKELLVFLYKLRQKYLNLKINTKIAVVYLLFLVFSVFVSSQIYQKIYSDIIFKQVSGLSTQNLYSISSNIDTMFTKVGNFSKTIFFNEDTQNILRNPSLSNNFDVSRRLNLLLSGFIESEPEISSIYLFDNKRNKFAVDKHSVKSLRIEDITLASWYDEAWKNQGRFILKLNAGGIFKELDTSRYISLIRVVNDTNTLKPIGIIVINISADSLKSSYKDIVNKYRTDIALYDENWAEIVAFNNKEFYNISSISSTIKENDLVTYIERKGDTDYLITFIRTSKQNWGLVSALPLVELSKELGVFSFVAFIVILINSFLLFVGLLLVSRLITLPIRKLIASMKSVEKGEFQKVEILAGTDEIGKLRDGYNLMISEIEKLIKRIIEEQKTKRKAELDVLQAQIKPHFLYNIIDTMSYLALEGKCDQLYEALEALGCYYRTSLSKGSEVITIREEIEIVKNYITLQKLRYGDAFTVDYSIDEEVYEYKILKLVLQPLIENSLYHGIKPKGELGKIIVSARLKTNSVIISVEDDGVGMSEEELDKVMCDKIDANKKSFGLRGTIERIQIFYGVSDIYSIESQKRYGTKVSFFIPREKRVEDV